jgi:type IV pilus assembly protein PilC
MDFQYIGYTTDRRTVKGTVAASSEERAIGQLNSLGYQVLSIRTVGILGKISNYLTAALEQKVKPREIIMFSRQLAILLESGVDIISALDLFKSQASNRTFEKVIEEIVAELRGGTSFSNALGRFPKVFSVMYCRTIAAGEESGNLDEVLRRMADYIERAEESAKKIKSALTYPVVVFVVSIVVVAVLVFFVLPTYAGLYENFGAELPGITKFLIGIANWAIDYAIYVLLLLVAIVIGFVIYTRRSEGKKFLDRSLLRLPILGQILLLNELARSCRTISMLVRVGLPLPDIITMCVQSSSNTIISQALSEVRQDMLAGEGLADPMAKRDVFLPLMVQMVSVGEKTGNLGNTLNTVAESFETESDDKTTRAIGLLGPAVTIGIALVVGFIVVAMVSAMYGVYGQIATG